MLVFILAGLTIAELLMYTKGAWGYRRPVAVILAIANTSAVAALCMTALSLYSALIACTMCVRIFNYLRIVKGRSKPEQLVRSSRRVTISVGLLQFVLLGMILLNWHNPSLSPTIFLLVIVQACAAIALFAITQRNIQASHFTPTQQFFADRDLPSLTVAIPARNETLDMEDCLHSILASDYPKLEVIVFDDSSQDKTPEIIRQFAHDGVRFVQGAEPTEHWLAKNMAYERLFQEASGELILFCGVDVRFQPESLRRIVTALLTRNKQMISIMPRRFTDSVAGSFIQPMRYWWELALPRRQFDRPPVLSTCWIINRTALSKLGGFASVGHSVIPEQYFARELVKTDAYSFLRSDTYMSVETQKTPAEQRATAIRVLYPQLHRRPELACGIAALGVIFFLGPFVIVGYALITSNYLTACIATVAALFLIATHVSIIAISSPPSIPIALINYPLAVLMEIMLGLTSLYKYEFSSVIWKGRSITPPNRLDVIPHLPTLD